MKFSLSSCERTELLLQHKRERDRRVADRIKAVLLKDEGWREDEIARVLFLSHEGVRQHISNYIERKKLKPTNGGSASYLSLEQGAQLVLHLEQKTYRCVKEIIDYVRESFGITYAESGMTKWLHHHGFSYHKPAVVPAKADGEAQKRGLKRTKNSEDN